MEVYKRFKTSTEVVSLIMNALNSLFGLGVFYKGLESIIRVSAITIGWVSTLVDILKDNVLTASEETVVSTLRQLGNLVKGSNDLESMGNIDSIILTIIRTHRSNGELIVNGLRVILISLVSSKDYYNEELCNCIVNALRHPEIYDTWLNEVSRSVIDIIDILVRNNASWCYLRRLG